MTAVSDSRIFGNILRFEAALAKAQAGLGIIPQHAADEIVKHCRVELMDWNELRTVTELIGYPVLPVVKQLVKMVNEVEPGLGEWAHWGATTQVCRANPSEKA